MKKDEFLIALKDLRSRLGNWRVEVGEEIFAEFSMGCFYDANESKWKVYINNERGRHRIRYVTENEEDAYRELLSIAGFEAENNKYI